MYFRIAELKKLKKVFEGQSVAFVYLSIDQNINAWKISAARHLTNTDNSFLIPEGQYSNLFRFFGITQIPRYILMDKHGNVLGLDATKPSDAKTKQMLENALMNLALEPEGVSK